MSSLSRRVLCGSLLALGVSASVHAQQVYFVPKVEVSVEHHTNRERADDAVADGSMVYRGVVEALWGRRSPRSDIELRPRAILQEFPDRGGVEPLEIFLDLGSSYRTRKGEMVFDGRYRRQDILNAEVGQARFDDFDPSDPDAAPQPGGDDSGILTVGGTRTEFEVGPSFTYAWTERAGVEGVLNYESVRYDQDLPSRRVGYSAPYAQLGLSYAVGERTRMGIGPYATRYEAEDDSEEVDSVGAVAHVRHEWSERSRIEVQLRGETSDITVFEPVRTEASSSNWGLELSGERRNRVGKLRYSFGRFLRPSSLGGRLQSDEIRVQYDRPLSQRLGFNFAIRLTRDDDISDEGGASQRERRRADMGLRWRVTQTTYIGAGYRYAWQDFSVDEAVVDNHGVFLTFGFLGLDPTRNSR